MRVMADKLKHRAHIQYPTQTPNDSGGFDLTYATILSFWCEIVLESNYVKAVRGEQTEEGVTHIFRVRWVALKDLGKEFNDAFSEAFDNIRDVNAIKDNLFVFIQETVSYRGRRFKFMGMSRDEQFREWVLMRAHEEEEVATGAVV